MSTKMTLTLGPETKTTKIDNEMTMVYIFLIDLIGIFFHLLPAYLLPETEPKGNAHKC